MSAHRASTAGLTMLAASGLALALPSVAEAHQVGVSRGEYVVGEQGVEAKISLSRRDLIGAIEGLDADRDGALTQAELDARRGEVAALVVDGLVVRARGAPCTTKLASAELEAPDGVQMTAHVTCALMADELTLDLGFVDALGSGHRHVVTVTGAPQPFEDLVFRGKTHVALALAARPPSAAPPSSFGLGMKHGWTGLEQIALVAALAVLGGKLRASATAVGAFLVATWVGLALSAFGVFVPSARVVGPVVALTLLYVGADGALGSRAAPPRDERARWPIALPFGLIHGFACAGVFDELHVARASLSRELAIFQLGMLVVQVGVLAVLLPGVQLARRRVWFDRWVVRAVGSALAIAGLVGLAASVVRPAG